MKFAPKESRREFKNGRFCTAYEYPMNEPAINGAVIVLNGRYPETGRTVNKVCKEMAYAVKGNGRVVIEDREILVSEGDIVLIDPGEKFY